MTKTYHTWRQDAQALRAAKWSLQASDGWNGCEVTGPYARWMQPGWDGISVSAEGPDIMAAIRAATRLAVKRMEELKAEAQEKPNE